MSWPGFHSFWFSKSVHSCWLSCFTSPKAVKRSRSDTLAVAKIASASVWTAKMETEVGKQGQKLQARRNIVVDEGALLPEEMTPAVSVAYNEMRIRRLQNDRKNIAEASMSRNAIANRSCR